MPRWLLIAGGAIVLIALAFWAFRPSPPVIQDYRDELAELAAPDASGEAEPLAIGAQALLEATAVNPVNAERVRKAARWFDNAATNTPDEEGQAAFFAGLTWRLGGREDLATAWLGQVPEDSRYARAARAALR